MNFQKLGTVALIAMSPTFLHAADPPKKEREVIFKYCDELSEDQRKKTFSGIDYKKNDKTYRNETDTIKEGTNPFYILEIDSDAEIVASTETKRDSRIVRDLQTLENLAKAITGADKVAMAKPKCALIPQEYERANLEVTLKKQKGDFKKDEANNALDAKGNPLKLGDGKSVTVQNGKLMVDGKPVEDASVSRLAARSDPPVVGQTTLITGPRENLWLSADMGLNNIKQLTLDQNNNLVEKEKPASFYVGFNWKFGDVYQDYYGTSEWVNNFSAKFLLRASGTPSDSMGIGLGYEFPWVNLFVARVWTKGDPSSTGQIDTVQSNVVGISFDLSKGLGWLKGDKSK